MHWVCNGGQIASRGRSYGRGKNLFYGGFNFAPPGTRDLDKVKRRGGGIDVVEKVSRELILWITVPRRARCIEGRAGGGRIGVARVSKLWARSGQAFAFAWVLRRDEPFTRSRAAGIGVGGAAGQTRARTEPWGRPW